MENWQQKCINDNLAELVTNIKCDVVFLAYLAQYGALSPTEMERLHTLPGVEAEKATALMRILQTRVGGYKHLAKALRKCIQTGAFAILLKGIQQHTIFRDVLFHDSRLPLKHVSKSIDEKVLRNIIAGEVNAETYEKLLDPEPWTIAVETIPKAIPYYIPRSLSVNTQIDSGIFQNLENDIFCIEGVEIHQLSNLTHKDKSTQKHNPPDWSRNQTHGLTTRFVVLESHDHFPDIVQKAKYPVHWLKYEDGKYFYVKSSLKSEVKNVSKFLVSKCEAKLSEDEFVERCANESGNEPVFIYDSPGMGKSVLLAKLARKMKESRQEDSVVYFEISELIQKVRQVDESCSFAAVKQTLVDSIAVNGLGRKIMANLLDASSHQINLFLDGYDELHQNEISSANKMLDNLVKDGKNICIFVATRPHKREELEDKFGVLGYNILPFDHSNKLSFFLQFWETVHGIKTTDAIKKFAEHCLKNVSFEMSSGESDIAEIPLQCRMLAEIYARDAKGGDLIPSELQFHLNSIFKVYRHYIDSKFSSFCNDSEKEMCYEFHVREAINTLFSETSKIAQWKDLVTDQRYEIIQSFPNSVHDSTGSRLIFRKIQDTPIAEILEFGKFRTVVPELDLIYRIGIMEPSKSDSGVASFLHRTFAEFFAAEFLATSATLTFPKQNILKEFIDLFFQQALTFAPGKRYLLKQEGLSFRNHTVCRFLDFFLSSQHSLGQDFETLKDSLRSSKYYNSDKLFNLLMSSLKINAVHLFCFLVDLYLDLDKASNKTVCCLRFKQSLQDTECWEDETKKVQLVKDLRERKDICKLVTTSAKYSSLQLVQLSCEFLESITGSRFHEFPYPACECLLKAVLQRGHYQIFDYLLSLDRDGLYKLPLLLWCMNRSADAKNVVGRVQILKMILDERPDLVNKYDPKIYNSPIPLLARRAHISLVKLLIEAGADLSQTNEDKENIAHRAAENFSPEEYHEFVQFIISRNAQILFKQRHKRGCTPVHEALRHIDLKCETLELLVNKCNVNFNENATKWGSELAIAIENGRSEKVIKDIIRLGGTKIKLYRLYRLDKWYKFIFGYR